MTLSACGLFPSVGEYGTCAKGCPGGAGGASTQSSTTGASSGTGSDVGSTTGTGSGSGGGSGDPCALKSGMHGGLGIYVDRDPLPHFCIDPTETSIAEYAEFLDFHIGIDVLASSFPQACQWKPATKDAATPKGGGNPYLWLNYPETSIKPVQGTDWCDAAIYCQWAGKRLCAGELDQKTIDSSGGATNDFTWTQSGEWYRGCRGKKNATYGYGDTYDLDALGVQHPTSSPVCNTESNLGDPGTMNAFRTTDVDKPPGCASHWDHGDVIDLIGNVLEWEDNCDAGSGATPDLDTCYPRGGALNQQEFATCEFVDHNTVHHRNLKTEYIGFRCCWTP